MSAIRLEPVRALARELRFAPAETLLRAVERIEALAGEIEGGTSYPVEWLVFRVTGYRPEGARRGRAVAAGGDGAAIPGTRLLADLSALAERLSEASGASVEQAERAGAVRLPALCARWSVSAKTIERWRREGLIARRARAGRARAALVFMPGVVAGFEARRGERVKGAGAFTRIEAGVEGRMVRRAARYSRVLGMSASAIAGRLSRRFGRARETVRRLVIRRGAALGVTRKERVTARSGRAVLRAMQRGMEPGEIAHRWGVTRQGVVRASLVARRETLMEVLGSGALGASASPTFEHRDAEEVILLPAAVRTGLGASGHRDLLDLVRAGRTRAVIPAGEETARAVAYQYLRFGAARIIAGLDRRHPSATELDRVETMLRWAARLKAELVRTQLHLVVETLEGLIGAPPEELGHGVSSGQLAELVGVAIGAVAGAVDQFEPQRPARTAHGRLAAPSGLAVTRACTRWMKARGIVGAARGAHRATARLLPGMPMEDWTLSVAPWQPSLEPDERVRGSLGMVDEASRVLLIERFGWGGGPPRTLREIAAGRRTTVIRAVVMERKALRSALGPSRSS